MWYVLYLWSLSSCFLAGSRTQESVSGQFSPKLVPPAYIAWSWSRRPLSCGRRESGQIPIIISYMYLTCQEFLGVLFDLVANGPCSCLFGMLLGEHDEEDCLESGYWRELPSLATIIPAGKMYLCSVCIA